jgi:hypothetical protein
VVGGAEAIERVSPERLVNEVSVEEDASGSRVTRRLPRYTDAPSPPPRKLVAGESTTLHFQSAKACSAHINEIHRHFHCVACDCAFVGLNQVTQHFKSKVHMPSNHVCPGRCGARFITLSALIKHLEQQVCSSGCERADVDRFVRKAGRLGGWALLISQRGPSEAGSVALPLSGWSEKRVCVSRLLTTVWTV